MKITKSSKNDSAKYKSSNTSYPTAISLRHKKKEFPMKIGDLNELGLKYEDSLEMHGEGHLFIYIKGQQFGEDTFSYTVEPIVACLKSSLVDLEKFFLPEIFYFNKEDIRKLIDYMYDDFPDDAPSKFIALREFTDKIDSMIVREGYYAFDQLLLFLVNNGEREKLFCFHDEINASSVIETEIGSTFNLFEQLHTLLTTNLKST